jgi:hypothetical protein
VASSDGSEEDEEDEEGSEDDEEDEHSYPMAGVCACILGEGGLPVEVLLAACVLRDGEARVPAYAFRDAFRGDRSMRSITLPPGLTSIGACAFDGCSSLTSIELPAGLTSLGNGAFYCCSSLTSIELPTDLTSLGTHAFYACSSMTTIALPAGLTSLGAYTFAGCSSMTSIELPAGLISLGVHALAWCSSLTSIELPAGLTSLGDHAFRNCSSLTSITLPAGLTSLGHDAFENCSSLTSIELPAGFDESILRSAGVPPSAHHGALHASARHGARPLLPTGLPECHPAPSCDSHRQSMSIELPARLASVVDHAILDQAIVPKAAQIKHAVRRLPFWCSIPAVCLAATAMCCRRWRSLSRNMNDDVNPYRKS